MNPQTINKDDLYSLDELSITIYPTSTSPFVSLVDDLKEYVV
jgi:hypothetical protein